MMVPVIAVAVIAGNRSAMADLSRLPRPASYVEGNQGLWQILAMAIWFMGQNFDWSVFPVLPCGWSVDSLIFNFVHNNYGIPSLFGFSRQTLLQSSTAGIWLVTSVSLVWNMLGILFEAKANSRKRGGGIILKRSRLLV